MRVCYLAYSALDLQAANSIQTFHTCQALAQRLGQALLVIVPRFSWREPGPPFRVVKIPRVPINKLSFFIKSSLWSYLERTLYAWLAAGYLGIQRLRGNRYDAIYSRDVICAFWMINMGARVIYEVHDLEARHPSQVKARWLSNLMQRVDERVLSRAVAIVSLTHTFKGELVSENKKAAESIFVIPDAYDEAVYFPRSREEARLALNLPLDAVIVGYAGLTFAYRRLDLLLDALKTWNDPRVRALIIGGRPFELDELKTRTRELNLESVVIIHGRHSADETARDLSACDILVIPDTVTDSTASPLKMFEYLALGRAIVAVDRPALREILVDGTAELFRAGDVADMVRALRAVADNPERRTKMEASAVARASEYTYARRADKMQSALGSISLFPA
ncbi:MAG TPA: glycosyltransferase family 4 protein [Anaerolineae bacterium]